MIVNNKLLLHGVHFFKADSFILGCEVYGHDHTVHLDKPSNPALHVFSLGIGETDRETRKLKTLKTILEENGHTNRTIHYLKADVEGAEIKVMRNWIDRLDIFL